MYGKVQINTSIECISKYIQYKKSVLSLIISIVNMLGLFILAWFMLHSAADGQFNRDISVYDGVIRETQRYIGNSHVVLFYAMDDLGEIYFLAIITYYTIC